MKKLLAILLCCVMLLSSSLALVSCNQPDEDEDKFLSFEIEGATDGVVAFSNEIAIKILVSNNDPSLSYAKMRVDEGSAELENTDEKGVLEIEIDDLNSEKRSDGSSEELVLKFDKRPSGTGYSYGAFSINLLLYEGKDSEKAKESEYIIVAYVMDSENIAFSFGDREYRDIYEKLPASKYRTRMSYLWPLSRVPMEKDGGVLGAVCMDTEIEGAQKHLIGEPFNINVGIASRYPVSDYTGVLTITAEGFSIVNEAGDTSKGGFSQSYEHFVSGYYPYEMQYDSVYESQNVIGDTYGKWEKLSLICDDKSEGSGEIKFVLEADWGYIPEGNKDTGFVYYAKDGEYIVYSLVSVDAAKRELYSETEYFWKVTVPEFFDDLFDGCD